MAIVFKLLFHLHEKVTVGSDFFETVGNLLAREYGSINGETATCPFIFRAITPLTVEPCASHLLDVVKTQMSQVKYLMKKSEAMHTLNTKFPCCSTTAASHIIHLDAMAVTIMINVAKVLCILSNIAMGLTAPMMEMIKLVKHFYYMVWKLTLKLSNTWKKADDANFEELK